jgi:hypothetical protein
VKVFIRQSLTHDIDACYIVESDDHLHYGYFSDDTDENDDAVFVPIFSQDRFTKEITYNDGELYLKLSGIDEIE